MKTDAGLLHYEIAWPHDVLEVDISMAKLLLIDMLCRAYSPLSISYQRGDLTRGKPLTPHSSSQKSSVPNVVLMYVCVSVQSGI